MPCTAKKTFAQAAAAGALPIAQVKDNQPILHQRVEQVCQAKAPLDQHTSTEETKRSRHETRLSEVFDPGAALADTEWRDHVGAIIRVFPPRTRASQKPVCGRLPPKSPILPPTSYSPRPLALTLSVAIGRLKTDRIMCATAASARTTAAFAAIQASSHDCDPLQQTFYASTVFKTSAMVAIALPSADSMPCSRYVNVESIEQPWVGESPHEPAAWSVAQILFISFLTNAAAQEQVPNDWSFP